jgi:hypothetical protein
MVFVSVADMVLALYPGRCVAVNADQVLPRTEQGPANRQARAEKSSDRRVGARLNRSMLLRDPDGNLINIFCADQACHCTRDTIGGKLCVMVRAPVQLSYFATHIVVRAGSTEKHHPSTKSGVRRVVCDGCHG